MLCRRTRRPLVCAGGGSYATFITRLKISCRSFLLSPNLFQVPSLLQAAVDVSTFCLFLRFAFQFIIKTYFTLFSAPHIPKLDGNFPFYDIIVWGDFQERHNWLSPEIQLCIHARRLSLTWRRWQEVAWIEVKLVIQPVNLPAHQARPLEELVCAAESAM